MNIYFGILLTFLTGVLIEFLWVFYDRKLIDKKWFKAGLYSALMGFCTWIFTVIVVEDKYIALLYPFGLFLGAIIAGKFIDKKIKKHSLCSDSLHKLERQLDKYNHILELLRTIGTFIAVTGTIVILLKLFGKI